MAYRRATLEFIRQGLAKQNPAFASLSLSYVNNMLTHPVVSKVMAETFTDWHIVINAANKYEHKLCR